MSKIKAILKSMNTARGSTLLHLKLHYRPFTKKTPRSGVKTNWWMKRVQGRPRKSTRKVIPTKFLTNDKNIYCKKKLHSRNGAGKTSFPPTEERM